MNDRQVRLEQLLGYLEVDSGNFALLSEVADLYLQNGDWANARGVVERALALQPQHPVTRYRMAVILLGERRPEQSLAITQDLLDAGETHIAVRFEHGRGLAMSARFEEAEPVLAGLLSDAASFPELPHLYIRTLHYLGKVEQAIEFGAGYAAEHPDDAVAQGMLSLLFLDNNDLGQAAALSASALDKAPDNMDALLAAGSVALAFEKEDEAQTFFDKAISIHANSGRAWLGKGLVSMLHADLDSARADLQKAVELMPKHLGTYNTLAWIQILQRDHDAAKKTLETSLEVDANFGETHGGLAVLAAIEGDWDNAKRLADIAVRLQPESFSGQFARSLILGHRNHPERGQALLESMFSNFKVPGGGNLQDALQRFARKRQNRSGRLH
ncbi:MAG: tetratricopeptide repeat protein [Pseudomonadota bacterium]